MLLLGVCMKLKWYYQISVAYIHSFEELHGNTQMDRTLSHQPMRPVSFAYNLPTRSYNSSHRLEVTIFTY